MVAQERSSNALAAGSYSERELSIAHADKEKRAVSNLMDTATVCSAMTSEM